jgi:cytoskeletal protein CcmA (bactofilin family)
MMSNLEFTYIGKNNSLKGEFLFKNETKIAGKIEGIIKVENESKITLEIGSFVLGTIEAHHIDIYGDFEGELTSSGLVSIFPTANVYGKIKAHAIEVLPGANLNMIGHTE